MRALTVPQMKSVSELGTDANPDKRSAQIRTSLGNTERSGPAPTFPLTFGLMTSSRFQRVNTFPSLSSYNTSCHGCKAEYSESPESPRTKRPIQGAHHWKSKCRENFDFAESLRYNRESAIQQRVCDTTESPVIYRSGPSGTRKRVCAHSQRRIQSHHDPSRLNSNPQ
jgi:hypothetical protein